LGDVLVVLDDEHAGCTGEVVHGLGLYVSDLE
jgi:hypothetical protein